jgi:putative ABC transport system permease protein
VRGMRAWLVRLAATLRPGQRERELNAELESHLQLHIDDCMRRGMSAEEATREARLRLGGLAQAKESLRERSRLPGLDSLIADVRFGLRLLGKRPGFAAVAILTIALGVGANTSIFSLVDAVLWSPLPFPQPDRVVLIGEGRSEQAGTTSFATWTDWRARTRAFEEIALVRDWGPTLTSPDSSEQLVGGRVTAGFFRTLGVRPALGRDFLPSEDTPDTRRVVILGHDLWRRRFAADPDIVGKSISLGATPFMVVGVLPDDSSALVTEATRGTSAEIWAPLGYDAAQPWACRTCRHVSAIGRLRGDSVEVGRAEVEAMTGALWKEHPTDYPDAAVTVVPLADQLVGSARPVLRVLLAAVACVWLIACVNLALLLLARATHREREVAVRMALGAGRARVLRQLLCENCVLALLGAAAGLIPAALFPRALAAFGPRVIPRLAEVTIDGRVLLFAFGLAIATGLLSGLGPALRLTASAGPGALRDGTRTSAGARGRRLRNLLVVAEIALSLTLLVGAGLMVRSLWRLLDIHPGFEPDRVLTMNVSLVGPRSESEDAVRAYFDQVLERVRAVPGVEAAAVASQVPLGGNFDGNGFHPEGKMAANPEQDPSAQRYGVAGDYLRVMGIPLVRGRGLARTDGATAPRVLLINQTAAARVWPGEDPIGKRVKMGGIDEPWWTVVGVVGDVRHQRLDETPDMQVYMPHAQWRIESTMILTVRTRGSPLELAPSVAQAVRSIDPMQPVSSVAALDQVRRDSLAGRRLSLAMLGLFAGLALVLSAIGIYGVTSYGVAQRTHEIGIRLALGARPGQLVGAVVREGAVLAAAGIAAGTVAALALTRLLTALLYGVSPTDPATFAAVALILGGVAIAAAYVPARRVASVAPTEALRAE